MVTAMKKLPILFMVLVCGTLPAWGQSFTEWNEEGDPRQVVVLRPENRIYRDAPFETFQDFVAADRDEPVIVSGLQGFSENTDLGVDMWSMGTAFFEQIDLGDSTYQFVKNENPKDFLGAHEEGFIDQAKEYFLTHESRGHCDPKNLNAGLGYVVPLGGGGKKKAGVKAIFVKCTNDN